jgi:integrase
MLITLAQSPKAEKLAAPPKDAFRLLLLTGPRREEVCDLRLGAVSLETGV